MTQVNLRATPAAKGWVEVWLIGSGGQKSGALDLTADKVLLDRVARVQLDATGLATVELLPTASITPAGTVYRADFNAGGVKESLVFGGFTGDGPVEATDYIVDVPGALLPAASAVAIAEHVAAVDPHAGYVLEATLGAANGVATLGADQKIPGAQLPSLAIGETFTVASQAAMLALTAQRGDVAVRTDLDPDGFFLLAADDPTTLANWVQITAPGAVTSVDGAVGAVSLSATYVTGKRRAENGGVNIVLGWDANVVATDLTGSTIIGDGTLNRENVIGGGVIANVNTANSNVPANPADLLGTLANHSIVGGYDNVARALKSVIFADHSYTLGAASHPGILSGAAHSVLAGDFGVICGGSGNVLSGSYAAIIGGVNNNVSGAYSFCAGQANTVSGTDSVAFGSTNTVTFNGSVALGVANSVASSYSVAAGRYAATRTQGQISEAQSRFASTGDAQVSRNVHSKQTTDGTASQLLGVAGTTAQHSLLEKQTVLLVYWLTARDTANGDSKAWRVECLLKRELGGSTTAVAAATKTVLGASAGATAWDTAVSPSGSTLGIRVTGEAAKTIRWVAKVELIEVGSF